MANKYGKWKIDRSLSEGGQAHIFLVHNENDSDERTYVLKRIKNLKRIDRLKDEISAISQLDHSNILKLIDYELDSDHPYLVTEYCEGGTLSNADLSNLSFLKKLYLFRDICKGVAHAHNNGIVHRDLKPENIFFRDDNITPVVGDFGICFMNESGRRITLTEEAVGSRNYIAPEMEDGRVDSIGKTVDVYSLGKILYWIISGKIFSREKHREYEWDLARKDQNLEDYKVVRNAFINELLDWSISDSPEHRFYNARHFATHVDIIIRRFKNGAHPIDQKVFQLCDYCGKGHYKLFEDTSEENSSEIERFGIRHVDQAKWMILHCGHCGHVQQFRIDLLKKNPWKENVRPW